MSDPMQTEWLAWQAFCREFTTLTAIDINDPRCNQMVAAVRLWGEELSELRFTEPQHRDKALADALAQYSLP